MQYHFHEGGNFTSLGETAVINGSGTDIDRHFIDHLTPSGAINNIDEDVPPEATKELFDDEGTLVTVQSDGSDPEIAQELVDTAVDRFGGLDIVVNNVDIANPTNHYEEIEYDDFMTTMG